MQTTITARHCEISDELRARAQDIVSRLGTFAARPVDASVVFDVDGTARLVELRMHVARGDLFVARGEAADHRSALDRAEAKLRRQVEKAFGAPRRSRPSTAPQL